VKYPPIILPWPDRTLHPNARPHWGQKARAAKKARMQGGWATIAAGIRKIEAEGLLVTARYFPPSRRAHDEDGVMSNLKSYFDGIADVTGVDDSKWSIRPVREEPIKGGEIRIELEVAP
jgi:crossover junction endodeoxyribonuclease RusA